MNILECKSSHVSKDLVVRNVTNWKSALARPRESLDNDFMDVLYLSFDGLNQREKKIFLHIACFFNHLSVKYVKNILNCCGFHADIGLIVLIDKSFIRISNSMIEMHSLLEGLGRRIVQGNSSKGQRKWSKLSFHEQLEYVIMERMVKLLFRNKKTFFHFYKNYKYWK